MNQWILCTLVYTKGTHFQQQMFTDVYQEEGWCALVYRKDHTCKELYAIHSGTTQH